MATVRTMDTKFRPLERRQIRLWNIFKNKVQNKTAFSLSAGLIFVSFATAQQVDLEWQSADARNKLGGYSPQRLKLSANKPEALKKAPADLSAPLYGAFKIGPKESPANILVILDEPEGKPARLFVDVNANGDLMDDPPAKWEERKTTAPGGKENTMYEGDLTVKIPYSNGPAEAHLFLYRFDKNDERRAALKDSIFYYRDYALSGVVKLGDKSYPAMLVDEMATGDFRGRDDSKYSGVSLLIDSNGDGKFDGRRESFDIKNPFNVAGTTWELADLTANGHFKIVKSSQSVEEIKPAPDLSKGAKAPAFTGKTTAGKSIKFPEDYKGKVVMLDFWATWCGPCVAEVPNVVANYEKFHDKGFEILGISLDQPNAAEKLASFTKQKKMPWDQIYDGKGWQAAIGQLYGIDAIPHMLIINGNTGEILGADVRGQSLGPAIEQALAKTKK